jgi:hypothetical protein
MSMGNDRDLEELAATANALVDTAIIHEDLSDKLLRNLETALNALDSARTELTCVMPNEIAQQAAQKVVQSIADLVTRKLENVLEPAEQRAQNLLRAMNKAVEEYQRAARKACIICGCTSGLTSAILVVFAMWMLGIGWGARP